MSHDAYVLVVDDEPDARAAIVALLGTRGLRAKEYPSAESVIADLNGDGVSCMIVDRRLEGMSGLELIAHLSEIGRSMPTIVVSGFADVPMTVEAMKNGSVTVLEKPVQAEELLPAVERALKLAEAGFDRRQRKSDLAKRFAALKPEERDVLQRVLLGTPNKKIATDLDIGLRTVELRRSHIMKKTGATSLPDLIQLAIEAGFPNEVSKAETI